MNVISRIKIHHIVLVLAVSGVPQTIQAATPSNHQQLATAYVNYADLNLSNEAGKAALYYRISNASRAVCGVQNSLTGAGSLKQLLLNRECYAATIEKAFAEVKQAGLASVNRSR